MDLPDHSSLLVTGRKCGPCCYDNGVAHSPDSASAGSLHTVFLDRDGVINEKMPEGSYVTAWADFHLLPGVPEAIASLNRAGLRVIVVSNQRGVALGKYTAQDVETIHANLEGLLEAAGAHVDAYYFCPHDKNQCNCRKPLPGMFEQARRDFPGLDAATSLMIGDSPSDIEFGRRLGMRTAFIVGDPERQKPGAQEAAELADHRFQSLREAVEALVTASDRRFQRSIQETA
jgi:D-glycero-D-manno-heptose 1,7-bisphosphate phosphatase